MKLRMLLGLAVVAGTSVAGWAKDAPATSHPAPNFTIDNKPVDRSGTLPASFAPVVSRARQSVVYISSKKRVRHRDMSQLFQDPTFRRFFGPMMPNQGQGAQPRSEVQESLGSGVIVSSNGYVITNNHVVEGTDDITVKYGDPETEHKAKVIGRDAEADVAVLKIDGDHLPAAVLGDSKQLQVGDTVLAIGDPFGIGLTVTHGIVSALGRNNLQLETLEDFIQTDAPINPGNSGGALLDLQGRVVGINTAILSRTGGSNGVGFAIPINLVRSIAEQLISKGKVSRGVLGVIPQDLTPDLADQFGTNSGALISDVKADSPADKAGLKSGDVVTKVNGTPVTDAASLRLTVSQIPPGTSVPVEYFRNNKKVTATVVLGDRSQAQANDASSAAAGSDEGVLNGVSVGDITPDIRNELSLPQGVHGVEVTEVAPDSASALAGLQKGDVILDLNRQAVRNAQEAIKLSSDIKGPKVLVHYWRNNITQYLVVDESQAPSKTDKPDGGGNGNDSGNN